MEIAESMMAPCAFQYVKSPGMVHYPTSSSTLSGFKPRDRREAEILERLIQFWDENGDGVLGREIASGVGHITALARIENRDANKLLLVYGTKESRWKYPGAHVAGSPFETARAEASRALGQDVGLVVEEVWGVNEREIEEYWTTPTHWHFEIIYRFVVEEGEEELPRGARWFDVTGNQLIIETANGSNKS
jgi:hypothetical protein